MYDPFDREAYRAQRRYARDMRRNYRYQNPMRGVAGGLILLALIFAFAFHGSLSGVGFLALLFIGLAFASLFGAFSTYHHYGVYGGFYSFIWFLGLALCFTIGFWPWILLPIAVSMVLGALYRPIVGGLAGAPWLAGTPPQQQPDQPQPYQQQQPQPGYQQGYQGAPPQSHETYQEGGQQHELPQTPNPQQQQQQELPPMEQQS
jgi:hypothetical protein